MAKSLGIKFNINFHEVLQSHFRGIYFEKTIRLVGLELMYHTYIRHNLFLFAVLKHLSWPNHEAKTFGARCAKCDRTIGSGDWVRRARERVYHLACFACDICSRQLSTGEQFALIDAKLLCKAHYLDIIEGNNTSSSEDCDSEQNSKCNKTKRVRTTFTEEQLSVLQANFQLDSNPDGQDLERIAHVTGLSKRVTQVWFQNSRARQKKHSGKIKPHIDW